MADLPEGTLLGMGNPLLDLQATVEKDFLDKWGLKENDAILCDDNLVGMFDELFHNYKVEFIPGGATQNVLRVCQWILKNPNRTTFFGAIGKDKYGELLAQKAMEAGVNGQYQISETVKTGTCAALINGQHRSLCAHLAAANTFSIDHILKEENHKFIEKANFYYSAGFFLTVCPPALQHVAQLMSEKNKPFLMNLSAPFISEFFFEPLSAAYAYADYVFGNEDESLAFAKAAKIDSTDMKEIAHQMAIMEKVNPSRPRTVVITQGAEPVLVAIGAEPVREFPIKRLPKEKIVDTNGAGDAFCGGFLAQLIQGKSIEECVACANYAAGVIIQQQGCTFPDTCEYH